MPTQLTLVSVEIGRKGEAWAHVSEGDDDELVIPISTENLPQVTWSKALVEEVQQKVQSEGALLKSATVK